MFLKENYKEMYGPVKKGEVWQIWHNMLCMGGAPIVRQLKINKLRQAGNVTLKKEGIANIPNNN